MTVTNSTVSGNSASGNGGGIYGSTLTVSQLDPFGQLGRRRRRRDLRLRTSDRHRLDLSGNLAGGNGGGIYGSSTRTVTNSTVSGNSAGNGGGIYDAGTVTVTNSTLSGNLGRKRGGGIYNYWHADRHRLDPLGQLGRAATAAGSTITAAR